METEQLQDKKEDILNHLDDYADTFYRLTILKLTQKAAQVASTMIMSMIVYILGLLILFLASLGAAWWLGDIIKSRIGGFMIMVGFYFILFVLVLLFRKKIIFPFLRNFIVKKVYD